jgi:hypothetical protein
MQQDFERRLETSEGFIGRWPPNLQREEANPAGAGPRVAAPDAW